MKNKGPSVILYSHNQRKSDNLDNYNEESKQRLTATDDAPGDGEGASNHSKDYIQEKLNASGDHESGEARTFTLQETIWKKTYLATRITLGSLNLCSLCLKIPILILIIRVLVELVQAKKEAETVTTIEPPYDDEPVPVPPGGDEGKSEYFSPIKSSWCHRWKTILLLTKAHRQGRRGYPSWEVSILSCLEDT